MKKRTLTILLALALCAGLAAPAMAAGGTTVTTPGGSITITNVVRQSVYEEDIVDVPGVGYGSWHHQTIYWVPDTGADIYLNGAQKGEPFIMENFYFNEADELEYVAYEAEYPAPVSVWLNDKEKQYPELYTEEYLIAVNYQETVALIGFVKADSVSAPAFTDVPGGAYYADAVDWAVAQKISNGTAANTFSPELTCTRGQIITALWRAAGMPEPKGASPFTDVKQDAYYAKAAAWAAGEGMASGRTFSPEAPCTRLMMAEFLWKYAGSPVAAKASFTDVSSKAVDWAAGRKIVQGTGANTFTPEQTCTRAQMVTFLYRAFA